MKIITLNCQILKVMYSANKNDEYTKIKELINNASKLGTLEWMITSRFSLWNRLRTRDFYKVFSRYLVETSKDWSDFLVEQQCVDIVKWIIKTTNNSTLLVVFCRQLVKYNSIATLPMIPYMDISGVNAMLSESFCILDVDTRRLRASSSRMTETLEGENLELQHEIEDLRDQLVLYNNL